MSGKWNGTLVATVTLVVATVGAVAATVAATFLLVQYRSDRDQAERGRAIACRYFELQFPESTIPECPPTEGVKK